MRLLGVELTRLRWRRTVLALLAAAILIPLVIGAAVVWDTRPVSTADLVAAQEMADQQADDPFVLDEIEQCVADPEMYGAPVGTDVQQACEEMMLPQAEWFISRTPLDLSSMINDLGPAIPILLVVLMLLLGATFVGADWASGSMSNQLLFEPRRTRVWAAKAAAVALVAAVTAFVVQLGFWAALALVARSRDVSVNPEVWDSLVGIIGRGTLLVAGAAIVGFSLTMAFRSTVATLGLLFAVTVGSTILIATLPLQGNNERWMVPTNLSAFVLNGTDYYNTQEETTCSQEDGEEMVCTGMSRLGVGGASAYLGFILVGTGALGWQSFRRRDVP